MAAADHLSAALPRIGALAAALALSVSAHAQNCGLYEYRAVFTKVYDGDTLTADVDLAVPAKPVSRQMLIEAVQYQRSPFGPPIRR